jgi:RimJ/RimL family protein N-acetyltransferase
MTQISTTRLQLRLMTHDDVDTFVAYRSDPSTAELMDTKVPPTPDRVHEAVDEMAALGRPTAGAWVRLAVTRLGDDEMIGDVVCNIRDGGGIAEVGYVFRPEFRGAGYAGEATGALIDHLIEHHEVHRLEASLSPLNVPSMRVLESVGMTFETLAEMAYCVDGVWEDDLRYAMSARERTAWLNRQRSHPQSVELVVIEPDEAYLWGRLRTHYSQQEFVATMPLTWRDALFPESFEGVTAVPWMRGVVADAERAAFVMLSSTHGLSEGQYLWRLLVDRMHQRRGIGRRVLAIVADELRSQGERRLFTSCGEGLGSPRPFYEGLGFEATGRIVDDETELVLTL